MRTLPRLQLPCTCVLPGDVDPEDLEGPLVGSHDCPRHDLTIDTRTWAIELGMVK